MSLQGVTGLADASCPTLTFHGSSLCLLPRNEPPQPVGRNLLQGLQAVERCRWRLGRPQSPSPRMLMAAGSEVLVVLITE